MSPLLTPCPGSFTLDQQRKDRAESWQNESPSITERPSREFEDGNAKFPVKFYLQTSCLFLKVKIASDSLPRVGQHAHYGHDHRTLQTKVVCQ